MTSRRFYTLIVFLEFLVFTKNILDLKFHLLKTNKYLNNALQIVYANWLSGSSLRFLEFLDFPKKIYI